MPTILNINGQKIPVTCRNAVPRNREIQNALDGYGGPVFCECVRGQQWRLIPFPYDVGMQFRRLCADDPHAEDCVYNLGLVNLSKYSRRLLDPRPVRVSIRSPRGTGSGAPRAQPAHRYAAFSTLVSELFSWINYATWGFAQLGLRVGHYRSPSSEDFFRAIPLAAARVKVDNSPLIQAAAAAGVSIRIGNCRCLPTGLMDSDKANLMITGIPLAGDAKIAVELWSVDTRLLAKAIPAYDNAIGKPGPFLTVAAFDAGQCFRLGFARGYMCDGVMGPAASEPEARMMRYFRAHDVPACKVSGLEGLREFASTLGISSEIASALRHAPDFICFRPGDLPSFGEVTSYDRGEIAETHRRKVIERVEHYLQIAEGRIQAEIWQLAGPVPEQLHVIRSMRDYLRLKEADGLLF